MNSTYEVGQVIYVISRKESRVYPVLVVEETVRKTIEGRVISYLVQVPDKKGTVVPLEGITDRAFTTSDGLRDFLITSATQAVSAMVDGAVEIGRTLVPAGVESASVRPVIAEDGEMITVSMPDGTQARVKMPTLPVQI